MERGSLAHPEQGRNPDRPASGRTTHFSKSARRSVPSPRHRGQIAALVRALGGEPAVTDYLFWKRRPID